MDEVLDSEQIDDEVEELIIKEKLARDGKVEKKNKFSFFRRKNASPDE